mmetsp:Transcript_4840/g.5520  ORF Transcript_4840/g.5520 Transcript_4840/m.5520 type:complete len:84 (+) Transcript_4840:459-710(+)
MFLLEHGFGTDVDFVKSLSTGMRYDNAFEMELYEAIPLSVDELRQCCIEFKSQMHFLSPLQLPLRIVSIKTCVCIGSSEKNEV